jgi:general secretion pathway protein K
MRRRERGAALLLVLWMFMLLGVLAFDFGQYMRDDAMGAVNLAEETRGYYLAVAGMNRAIYDQFIAEDQAQALGDGAEVPPVEDQPLLLPVDGNWHPLALLGGKVEVRMTDEAARIPLGVSLDPDEDGDLNAGTLGTLLTAAITNLVRGGNQTEGVDTHEQKRIQRVVNSILDWLDPDDAVRVDGAEADYYEGLEPPRAPKNGVLDSPEELLLVQGVDADLFYGTEGRPGLRDLVSVFNPRVQINLRHASGPLLQALFGIDAIEAAEVLAERDGQLDGWDLYLEHLAALAQRAGQGLVLDEEGLLTASVDDDDGGDGTDTVSAVLVEARADITSPRNQSRVAAVVLLNDLDCDAELSYCRSKVDEGVTVLRWYDRGPWTADDLPAAPDPETAG